MLDYVKSQTDQLPKPLHFQGRKLSLRGLSLTRDQGGQLSCQHRWDQDPSACPAFLLFH